MLRFRTICKSEKRRNQYLPTAKIICAKRIEKMQKTFCAATKKNDAFSNKENDAVVQKHFWETHFLQVAERKNDYLLTAKSILSVHHNLFSA